MLKKLACSAFALSSVLVTSLSLSGCACGPLSEGAWKGDPQCIKQWEDERNKAQQKRMQELPNLKKKADSGDVKAQVDVGNYHVFQSNPDSDRAVGLSYFQRAGQQGDISAQRIFSIETHKDCRLRARKLGAKENEGPDFAPHCVAEWSALEALAKKSCARTSAQNSSTSIQVAVGEAFDNAGKSDDADFWYTVALTHCLTQSERTAFGEKAFTATPRSEGRSNEVRGAMWLGVRGRERFPGLALPSPEVEAKAKERLAMLREKVARSGIRPEL